MTLSKSPSLETLCASFSASVTRQAVDRRFSQAATSFLKACLAVLFSRISSLTGTAVSSAALWSRILVADSTHWPLKAKLKRAFRGFGGGASKAACKLQTVIDLLSGTILLFDYHRATRPDQSYGQRLLKILRPGDLILFDLGYYSADVFNGIDQAGAYFIAPPYHHAKVKNQVAQNVAELLRRARGPVVDRKLILGSRTQMAVRLVAKRNPSQKADGLRRKLREDCRKQGHGQPTRARLQFCDWTTLITNVPSTLMGTLQILDIYGTRWNIEIFFRDAKSHLNLSLASSSKRQRTEAHILAVLFLAALLMFFQGRANRFARNQREISLQKLITRLAEFASHFRLCLIRQSFTDLHRLLKILLRHAVKFHQPSRQTPIQVLKTWGLS